MMSMDASQPARRDCTSFSGVWRPFRARRAAEVSFLQSLLERPFRSAAKAPSSLVYPRRHGPEFARVAAQFGINQTRSRTCRCMSPVGKLARPYTSTGKTRQGASPGRPQPRSRSQDGAPATPAFRRDLLVRTQRHPRSALPAAPRQPAPFAHPGRGTARLLRTQRILPLVPRRVRHQPHDVARGPTRRVHQTRVCRSRERSTSRRLRYPFQRAPHPARILRR